MPTTRVVVWNEHVSSFSGGELFRSGCCFRPAASTVVPTESVESPVGWFRGQRAPDMAES
jgi:trehalose utilization protein